MIQQSDALSVAPFRPQATIILSLKCASVHGTYSGNNEWLCMIYVSNDIVNFIKPPTKTSIYIEVIPEIRVRYSTDR